MNFYWFIRRDQYHKTAEFMIYFAESEKEARQRLMTEINDRHDNIYNAMEELKQISYAGGYSVSDMNQLISSLEDFITKIDRNIDGLAEYESN